MHKSSKVQIKVSIKINEEMKEKNKSIKNNKVKKSFSYITKIVKLVLNIIYIIDFIVNF